MATNLDVFAPEKFTTNPQHIIELPHKISDQTGHWVVLDKSRTECVFRSSATVLMLCAWLLAAPIQKFIASKPQRIRSPKFNSTPPTF